MRMRMRSAFRPHVEKETTCAAQVEIMATRKLGRGKGALRTVSSSPVPGSLIAANRSESPCTVSNQVGSQDQVVQVQEVRVTGITDVTSFWVQMGTAAQLEEFDMNRLQLSTWCSERGGGRISLPLVKNMIAVRDKASGSSSWSRAEVTKQISDSQVEVLYVDTGSSSRVSLSDLCSENPPKEMLIGVPRQAVHCFLHGVQPIEGQNTFSDRVTERFCQLVQLPCGSVKGIKNFVIDAKNAAITLYVQYEGSWLSVAEILKREGLVLYDPVCAITISDGGAMPSDDDATPTPTHSRLESFSSVGVTHDDGPTPVPSESSPLHFLPVTPPFPASPTHSLEEEDQSDSPPSLINGSSSVDTDSSSLGRKTDTEDLEEQSTITAVTTSGTPLLTITLPKLKSAQISSMSSMSAVTCNQLKLPLTLNMKRKHASRMDGSRVTPAAVSVQATASPPSTVVDGETSKLSASPLPLPLSKPHPTSESQVENKTAAVSSQPPTIGGVEQQQQEGQQKPVIESSTCTEDDDDADVIEIKEESELDTSGGGGEGEEKGNSVSADTLSSDDEWDESLLPPRSESSGSSPAKNDMAEVEEYFHRMDMKSNRRLWARNNSQKRNGPYRKNINPYHNDGPHQDQNKRSPAHNYHESLRRWGGYNSPPIESQDTNYNQFQGRPPTWCPGVGRGRRSRGPGGGVGGSNRSVGRGRYGNRNSGQGWAEEYPRPYPPPPYMDGIQQSQLVRKQGMSGAGRGRVRGVTNGGGGMGEEFDGYQSAPPPRYPPSQNIYSGGIRQSQLVKQPNASKQDFQRSSSSPSDGDNNQSFKPSPSSQWGNDGQPQREDKFTGEFMGSPGGCGQTPPSQPLPSAQSTGNLHGSGSGVYRGLTEEQIKNEVGWYTSAIERAVKKIVSSLTDSSTDQFASKILELLGDSKAQKLLSLSSLRTPLEVIMQAVVKGALDGESTDSGDVINTAIENLIDAAPHQACTFLQSSLIEVATEVSSSGGTSKSSQRFCSFLGRLFISASYSNKEDYSTAVGQAVKVCLDMWCAINTEVPDFQKVAYAQCFSFLCDEIGPTIDDSSKDNLDAYFDKHVPENILNEKLSRQVREIFLNLLVRRLNGWDGREKVEPSTISEAPPNQETTPTPTSETPIPPPIVTDYPVKAQNATDPSSGGSSVIQPVPISAITTPHLAARSVYHSSVTGGGEMQMDYGSVSMLSPQQPSSLFMPTTAHHHQHPHAHRTHSLPTCNALQQQVPTPLPSARSNSVSDVPTDDPYAQITEMLMSLSLMDLLPRFEEYMIKDYVLDCENESIKTCLQEASVPFGAVVGILDYIEKRRKYKKTSSSQQRSAVGGASHQTTPLQQMMSHPPVYSLPEPVSRSSAPTPIPPAAYLTQFQPQESLFPVIGSRSQIQADSATPTPTHYSMTSRYPPSQMKPFERPLPSQFPTSPHPHEQQQQQFQYTPPQQPQQVNSNNVPQQQHLQGTPSHQLQYHQQQSSSSSSPSHSHSQYQLPGQSHHQQQQQQQAQLQQIQGQEVILPRSPVVSLPHSSLTGGSDGSGGVATSPTTAQRRVTLPMAAVSPRGPPRLSQLQAPPRSHSHSYQERNTASNGSSGTTVRLPRVATVEGRLSSSSYQSGDPPATKPVGGFGTIMCVCCGASDHKTPDCPQRMNFFF